MAKINTTNYQPVTAWNGTQDLFVVEQPDGTKVATPEQVKQFVEAGDFEATGEVKDGHGNILAKKADVTTVIIPRFTPSQAGWRRICKIKPVEMHTVEGMIYVGGNWSSGQPLSASVAVNIMHSSASLTLLSSTDGSNGLIRRMRLIYVSEAEYWLDVFFNSYSNSTGPHKLTFTGDIAVSDIQDPISITTDATAATDEISIIQKVSGTVLTDKSGVSYKAGDVIANENVVAAAIGTSSSECYFSVPISKPVVASSVSISNVTCKVYYGTDQIENVTGATYTGSIKNGSILIKVTKASTFGANRRYAVDFVGTFTFS